MSQSFQSAKYLKEKHLEEVHQQVELERKLVRERRAMLGYFVVSLLGTLLLSGAFKAFGKYGFEFF